MKKSVSQKSRARESCFTLHKLLLEICERYTYSNYELATGWAFVSVQLLPLINVRLEGYLRWLNLLYSGSPISYVYRVYIVCGHL